MMHECVRLLRHSVSPPGIQKKVECQSSCERYCCLAVGGYAVAFLLGKARVCSQQGCCAPNFSSPAGERQETPCPNSEIRLPTGSILRDTMVVASGAPSQCGSVGRLIFAQNTAAATCLPSVASSDIPGPITTANSASSSSSGQILLNTVTHWSMHCCVPGAHSYCPIRPLPFRAPDNPRAFSIFLSSRRHE